MYSRLMSYLQQNNILTPNKFVFQENQSTYMAIVKIIDQIAEAIDNRSFAILIFFQSAPKIS